MDKLAITPITDCISNYNSKNRFHTPGHNGQAVFPFGRFMGDITELSFSDNLHNAKGIIALSERQTADILGVKRSLYYSIGATAAIQTALYLFKKGIIVVGDNHKSVYSALQLFDIPYTNVSLSELEQTIARTDYPAVFVTSPDYYGVTKPIEQIAQVCHLHNKTLIVDESWGSHFAFSSLLPQSATAYADIVINSYHKTTPALTSGAALHITRSLELANEAEFVRRLIHTTSPNYLILASIEYAIVSLYNQGEYLYKEIYQYLQKTELPNGYTYIKNDDFTKKLVTSACDMRELVLGLQSLDVYVETAQKDRLLFLITPYNYEQYGFAMQALSQVKPIRRPSIDEQKLSQLTSLIGKRAQNDIGLYPPAVPLVRKGAIITKEVVEVLIDNYDALFGV